MRRLLLLVGLLLLLPTTAHAEGTIAGEVARTGVWPATREWTPSIWHSGSSPGPTDVYDRCWLKTYHNVPMPYGAPWFSPSPDGDSEAIIIDDAGLAPAPYYEFWDMHNGPNGWVSCAIEAGTGKGIQGSGIPFVPGLPTFAEMRSYRIPHEVQVEVPYSCAYWKAPAIRTDQVSTTNDPHCIPLGQRWRLPAGTDCSGVGSPNSNTPTWKQAGRMVCEAARDYGLVATDQTHGSIGIRFEGTKDEPAASWQGDPSGDPYWDPGGWFGCNNVKYGTNNCSYPFDGFPWDDLVPIN